jgi:hypothetical protein
MALFASPEPATHPQASETQAMFSGDAPHSWFPSNLTINFLRHKSMGVPNCRINARQAKINPYGISFRWFRVS